MFSKVLIANRGEIACRVLATLKKMQIAGVAVYSEADADSPHVRLADEAVAIGPPAAAQSYLVAEKLIEAAKQTGAEAIHPGYGFLSENSGFAKAVQDAGLVFIGPNPHAIEMMGDKITSKKLADKSGVTIIPGAAEPVEDEKTAIKLSEGIGWPVMFKAAGGGGGKGMRVVRNAKEAGEALGSAIREAESSFGDGRVFVEKFIENPRHIEIQILCDKHGNGVWLGERECSLQRRNQKIIEECPSPFLDEETRRAMGEEALGLARAVDYDSAGTVEFVVDSERNFFFLEMNTRLQVEHPVTEKVYGLDLVEEMLRIAAGEKLRLTQAGLKPKGWAIEARICAEDPQRNFLPSTGWLNRYRPPAPTGETVRVDDGVEEGSNITPWYDPMVAKLITYGANRKAAIGEMAKALDGFEIRGIRHNLLFLAALNAHPAFIAGDLTTGFVDKHFPEGFAPDAGSQGDAFLAAALAVHQTRLRRRQRLVGRDSLLHSAPMSELAVHYLDEERFFKCREEEGVLVIEERGKKGAPWRIASEWKPGETWFHGVFNGEELGLRVELLSHRGYRLSAGGRRGDIEIFSLREAALIHKLPREAMVRKITELVCPMPGRVVKLYVAEGDKARAGEPLISIEAMKMENILRAEEDCTIGEIFCAEGDSLAMNDKIIKFG